MLEPWTRNALYAFAIIGNNLPDLDFTYSSISGKTFGYLLQHRGYTHTLPAVLGFALAMLGVLCALVSWRAKRIPRADWGLLSAVAFASPLLHIVMDLANNYGVHPLWPLYDGWFYGDSFFILEPSFWLVIVAPVSLSYRSKGVRVALWLVLAAALGALWYEPFVPHRNALALSLLTVGLLVLARKLSPHSRALLAACGFAAVAAAFVGGSSLAKSRVRERASLAFPAAVTEDIVATPTPANPFCWSVLLVQRDGAEYSVRLGRVALFPAWIELAACPIDRAAQPTAALHRVVLPGPVDARLALDSEYRAPLAAFRSLVRTRCEAQAFFRWARVPYLGAPEPNGARVLGDLRYDRKPGLDFSDIRLPPVQGRCPGYVPPWLPARSDILDAQDQ